MILKTWTGRELRVTTEVDRARGRAFYVVAGVGTFTLERDSYAAADAVRASRLHLYYGRFTDDHWYTGDREGYPEAPVVFGVKLGGGCVFDAEKLMADPGRYFTWAARRAGGGEAPAKTRKRVHEIATAIVGHYLARDDFAAIEHARAIVAAPDRLRKHTKRIGELRDEIAALQAELSIELAAADVQAALLPNAPEAAA